ncbi:MAG: hypothetical protein U1A72_08630 [Sulfuritalea sp.]|nr:hypothetical protein [Sulfuritalea sp.]
MTAPYGAGLGVVQAQWAAGFFVSLAGAARGYINLRVQHSLIQELASP